MLKTKELGGRQGLAINHLQPTNGVILFSLLKWEEVGVLRRTLRCFLLSSGLMINFSKSIIVGNLKFREYLKKKRESRRKKR